MNYDVTNKGNKQYKHSHHRGTVTNRSTLQPTTAGVAAVRQRDRTTARQTGPYIVGRADDGKLCGTGGLDCHRNMQGGGPTTGVHTHAEMGILPCTDTE